MPTLDQKIINVVAPHLPGYTLYLTMCSSYDFQDVKLILDVRTDWLIDLFRSCFTIHLTNGGNFFMLSTLLFLLMAESIHIHYGRLSPADLKERAETMGYATFAFLFVVLDIGCIVVRVAALVALSGTLGLATGLVFISMLPPLVLPLIAYVSKLFKERRTLDGEGAEV